MVISQRIERWITAVVLIVVLLIAAGCDSPLSSPSTIAQSGGLPTLHHLDWGFEFTDHALWSPDGHWLAVLAGSEFAKSHLEVISPDGKTQFDLSNWGCGQYLFFDYAWLPDGRLSCIRANEGAFLLCIGAYPFQRCERSAVDSRLDIQADGAVWTADNAHFLFTPNRCKTATNRSSLCVLQPNGVISQELLQGGLVYQPLWRPHTSTLSYILGSNLVLSTAMWADGQLTLDKPRMLVSDLIPDASRYTWSPSGRWIAARSGVVNEDKIYLINADHPEQTVDVTTYDTAQWLTADPVWSPDSKTLIVFTVSEDQPYAINIADYLHSKGLQP